MGTVAQSLTSVCPAPHLGYPSGALGPSSVEPRVWGSRLPAPCTAPELLGSGVPLRPTCLQGPFPQRTQLGRKPGLRRCLLLVGESRSCGCELEHLVSQMLPGRVATPARSPGCAPQRHPAARPRGLEDRLTGWVCSALGGCPPGCPRSLPELALMAAWRCGGSLGPRGPGELQEGSASGRGQLWGSQRSWRWRPYL